MFIVKSQGLEERKFNGLCDAIQCAWALADTRPGVYKVLDDNQSSYVTAATIHATIDLRDLSVADEYRAHYIASMKARRAFTRIL